MRCSEPDTSAVALSLIVGCPLSGSVQEPRL
jgi:hypothetical protein